MVLEFVANTYKFEYCFLIQVSEKVKNKNNSLYIVYKVLTIEKELRRFQ